MFLKLGPRRQEFPVAAIIPNLLTTIALSCGLASLHYSMKGHWDRAMAAIVLAGIFDALDGRAARWLHVTSPFGAVLDSLADFLSFGVAPAVLLREWMSEQDKITGRFGAVALFAFMTYAICAALRLARFTADTPEKPPEPAPGTPPAPEGPAKVASFFTGMPTPAAAGGAMAPIMLARSDLAVPVPAWAVAATAFIIGLLMISRVPMFSLKAVKLGRRAVAPFLLAVGLCAAGMLLDPWATLAGLTGLYVVSIPITAWRASARRRAGRA